MSRRPFGWQMVSGQRHSLSSDQFDSRAEDAKKRWIRRITTPRWYWALIAFLSMGLLLLLANHVLTK